jgi:hypothetical protein
MHCSVLPLFLLIVATTMVWCETTISNMTLSSATTLSNTAYSDTLLYVYGNGFNLTIESSIFNTTRVFVYNTSAFHFQSNVIDSDTSSIRVENSPYTYIYNTTIRHADTDTSTMVPCVFPVVMRQTGSILHVHSNTQTHTSAPQFPRFLCLHNEALHARIVVTSLAIRLEYPANHSFVANELGLNHTDPFVDALAHYYDAVDADTFTLEAEYPNRGLLPTSGVLSRAHVLLDLGGNTGTSVYLDDIHRDDLYTLASPYDGFSENITFQMDSLVRIDQYEGIGDLVLGSLIRVQSSNPDSRRAALRAGVVLTRGSVSALHSLFPASAVLPKSYQYLAKYLRSLMPNLEAFQADIEIEPNLASDEMNAWAGGDLCHYMVRGNATSNTHCILSDPITGPPTRRFSRATEGSCYGVTRSERLSDASPNCGYPVLKIAGPYWSNDAAYWASRDIVGRALTVMPEDPSLPIYIGVSDTTPTSVAYQRFVHPEKPLNDPFFEVYHPWVVAARTNLTKDPTEPWQYRLERLTFQDVTIQYNFTSVTQSGILFTIVRYHAVRWNDTSLFDPLEFRFVRSPILGVNVGVNPSLGQSAPNSVLELDANPIFYTNDAFKVSTNVTLISMVDARVYDIGRVFRGKPSLDLLIMARMSFQYMMRGWMHANAKEFQLEDLTCLDCFVDPDTFRALDLAGRQVDLASFARNLIFNSTLFSDMSGVSSAYYFSNYSQAQFENLISNVGSVSNGFYYRDLLDVPCSSLGRALIYNSNPGIHGNTHDVRCDPGGVGCSGDACRFDIGFIPTACYVDKGVSVFNRYFGIIYFHTITDAVVRCAANDGTNTRWIFVNPNAYYDENTILFTHYNVSGGELTRLVSLNGSSVPVVIRGHSHEFRVSSNAAWVDYAFEGVDFFNPQDVASYAAQSPVNSILRIASLSRLRNVAFSNVRFIGVVPLSPTALPLTTAGWSAFLSTILTPGVVHPYIRTPNTVNLLSLDGIVGNTTLSNVRFYGALGYGYREVKGIPGQQTLFSNVRGENLWGATGQVTGAANFTGVSVRFEYLNAAYSANFPYPVNFELILDGSTYPAALHLDDFVVRSTQNPVSNPYTSSSRFVIGNPFLNGLSDPIGYVRQLKIQGVKGSNFIHVHLRNVQVGREGGSTSVFPVGLEVADSDRIAWVGYSMM